MKEGSLASIATFSPPIKATITASDLPCIVIAIEDGSGDDLFLVIDTDGRPTYLTGTQFTFDFRYDPKTEIWSDPNETAPSGDGFSDYE
jgi:hypothetical protein